MANAKVVWHGAQVERVTTGAAFRAVKRLAESMERQAKLNASGRPGPQVQTGRLRSSISHDVGTEGRAVVGVVGTDVEYGPRIEMGFTGRDSLGRQYHQPPYPFLRPAFEYLKGFLGRLLQEEMASEAGP